MLSPLKILIVDDSQFAIEIQKSRLLRNSNIKAEELNIISAISYSEAIVTAMKCQPDMLFVDFCLSGFHGTFLIKELKDKGIIDYKTQCCCYSSNPDVDVALQLITDKYFILRGGLDKDVSDVFNLMYRKSKMCDINNSLDLNESIFLHNVFSIKALGQSAVVYFLNNSGKHDFRRSDKRFVHIKDDILCFDFMLQITEHIIINTDHYKEFGKEKENNNKSNFYVRTDHSAILNLDNKLRTQHLEYKITKLNEGFAKLKYGYIDN